MGIGEWLFQNWFDLFSTVGIIGSLCFTAFSLHSETETRRIANLLTITANHREVWKVFLYDKGLARVRDPSADTTKQPITDAERVYERSTGRHGGRLAPGHCAILFTADSARSLGKSQSPPER
jgi:hypothetical protein